MTMTEGLNADNILSYLIFCFCLSLHLEFWLFLWHREKNGYFILQDILTFWFWNLRKGFWVTLLIQVVHPLQNQSSVTQERRYSELSWAFLWHLSERRKCTDISGIWKRRREKPLFIPLVSSFLSFTSLSFPLPKMNMAHWQLKEPQGDLFPCLLWLLATKKCCSTYKKLWVSVN